MKKYIFIGLAAMVAMTGFFVRFVSLNRQYPSPRVNVAAMGQPLPAGGYKVTLNRLALEDGSAVQELLPGYVAAYTEDNKIYPAEKEKLLMAELTVEKTSASAQALDLTTLAFEAGAWSSHFDAELFMSQNPKLQGLLLDMEVGEPVVLKLPVVLLEDAFTRPQWKDIGQMDFSVVWSAYPEKYLFTR